MSGELDVDVNNLCRVVRTLEARMTVLLEAKAAHEQSLRHIENELAEVIHARHTIMGGIVAVRDIREEPEAARH